MSSFYGNGGGGGGSSSSSFDLSDRLAKGIDDQDNIVEGAIIEGLVESIEVEDDDGSYLINPNKATGRYSHAEGNRTTASGMNSHAEGYYTTASGMNSHVEGNNTIASGTSSHSEGIATYAVGDASHSEGGHTVANGNFSHSNGSYTIADGYSQYVIGEYNIAQGTNNTKVNTDYVFIIGNGTNSNSRSNALGIKWNGNFVFADGTQITPAEFASLKTLNQDIESLLSAI